YKTVGQVLMDLSAIDTRFQGVVWLIGEGPGGVVIKNTTLNDAIIKYVGDVTQTESYARISGIRVLGNNIADSIGIQIDNAAYLNLDHVWVEGVELGFDATDYEQSHISNCNFRWNIGGMRFNGNAGI